MNNWNKTKDLKPTITKNYYCDINNKYFDDEPYYVLGIDKHNNMKIVTYEQWDNDESPKWYDNSTEHWNLEDDIILWQELPKNPML